MMWIGVINCLAGIAPFCVDKTEHIVQVLSSGL
jgi:hypothetical protein